MDTIATNQGITIEKVAESRITEVDFANIPFGRVFSDHMLIAEYENGAWNAPKIVPYQKIEMFPAISALHYGQSVFEGLKAYKDEAGNPLLFRPMDNFDRLNFSARRLCMPEVPEHLFMNGLKELIKLDQNWIPTNEGSSLYIRPFMFATDEYVGIKPSDKYKLIIFTCPVGAYYPEPVGLWVTNNYVRAIEGGTGAAKAAGNYAGSLMGAQEAKANGYHNVLWLDGKEGKYIEECGTMNVCFVIDGKAVTPELTGTILNGITRRSTLQIMRDLGIQVEERRVTLEEIIDAYDNGQLQEVFGMGTAATIAHVAKIGMKGKEMTLPPIEERKVANTVLARLRGIRTGKIEDTHDWVMRP